MDEINVVRKKSHVWAWVIGLIILAAIIWAVVAMSSRGPAPASELHQRSAPQGVLASTVLT